jgi:serine/threonine-protein kinase
MSSLPCPPQHWPRFSTLLDAAMELPEPSRADWLAGLAGPDAEFRPWLARVLGGAAASHTGSFLDRPSRADLRSEGFRPGACLGPYKLESLLGEGGMGQVWRASRQDDGPQREVALKLPQPELLGGPFRARFRRERDVLAALSHPHIAQLYDAGVAADGHPYLALELVLGAPITEHCRTTQASLDRRLELMLEVLGALSYAHQRLIVHRDIKPSNVLVTLDGGVKLLDFGIAKLLRAEETGDVLLTQPAALLATPGYAAPEQFTHGTVTVAADVFSAGVLLFELVTGQRPFGRVPTEDGADAAPLASQRADAGVIGCPEGSRLKRLLRGDVDAVIAYALALDPADRYASAEAFAADLRRCRDGKPVSARRVGWASLAVKFVRRNKVGVALASVLALAVAGGTAGIAWQAQRAEREATRANAIKDFLIGLFEKGNPHGGGKPSDSMTAKELLDIGADQADAAFAGQPATEIELLETLGNIYDALNDSARAERVWARRLDLERSLYGIADPRVVQATLNLVGSEIEFMDEDKALKLLDSVRQPIFARYGAESLQRAQWLMGRANSLRTTHGGRDEAIADSLAAIAILEKHFPDSENYPDALAVLADYQYDAEQYADALATTEKVRAIEVAQHNFDAMDELQYHADAALHLQRLGRVAEAEAHYEQDQALAEHQLGRDSLWYLHAMTSRAQMAHLHGDRTRGLALFQEAMAISGDRAATTGSPNSLRRAYGAALAREGRAREAVPVLEAALAATTLHVRDEPNLRRAQGFLGDAYDQVGRTAEARALLKTARDDWMRYGPPGTPQTLGARERWARFLLDHGETEAAGAEYRAVLQQSSGAASAPAALAAAGLARIALTAGAQSEAEAQSALALRLLDATTAEYDVRARVDVWLVRADCLMAGGQKAAALDWAQKAVAAAEEYDAPESPQLARARGVLQKAS